MAECDICGREFDTERGVQVHRRQAHPDADDADTTTDTAEEQDERRTTEKSASFGNLTLNLKVTHAVLAAFLIGIFAGGFFVSALYGAAGVTGMLADGPSTVNDGGQDDSAAQGDDSNSNRYNLDASFWESDPKMGSADAPIKIIEVSDYGCPWCAEWYGVNAIPQRPIDQEKSFDKMVENYVNEGHVQFIYKDYPAHPNAMEAHLAANCVMEQSDDSYWEFHDALYERRNEWMQSGEDRPQETFSDIASSVGVDVSELNSCLSSRDNSEMVEDMQQARDNGFSGTPTFYIGNTKDGFVRVSGAQPYSSLRTVIDAELN